ncbi:MAG: CBS domain-containing protein [Pirellulales bacterium]
MMISDILRTKGTDVFWTRPDATLDEVTRLLVRHNCGSLVVLSDAASKRMLGIITERDILRACAAAKQLDQVKVSEVMTSDVVTGVANDSVQHGMGLMTEKRIRHLPVIENEELAGIISIGDLVKAQHDELSAENHYLKAYIQS